MFLRLLVCYIVLLSTHLLGQPVYYNVNLNQYYNKSLIDFGYRENPYSVTLSQKIKRLDRRYILSFEDSAGVFLSATPLVNFSLGAASGQNTLNYQNTRGGLILAGSKNFKCHVILAENQARFPQYQTEFIQQHGEFYPTNNGYNQQNGMVVGAGRTKPFKADGFDYSYSRGGFLWDINKRFSVFGGNQTYSFSPLMRSVFWSDHNQALLIGGIFKLNRSFSYFVGRGQLYDLFRKPVFANVESPYLKKGYSVHGFFATFNKHQIGTIYQSIWKNGDSLKDQRINPVFWVPIPLLDLIANGVSLPQVGFIYRFNFSQQLNFFAQGFSRGFQKNTLSFQFGSTYCDTISPKTNFGFSIYYLQTGGAFYGDGNPLSFTHQNLPLGSVLGNGGKEINLSGQFQCRNFFIRYLLNAFQSQQENVYALTPNYIPPKKSLLQNIELGLTLSKITEFEIFVGYINRIVEAQNPLNLITLGMKTNLFKPNYVY